jgi:hypothetical protein
MVHLEAGLVQDCAFSASVARQPGGNASAVHREVTGDPTTFSSRVYQESCCIGWRIRNRGFAIWSVDT